MSRSCTRRHNIESEPEDDTRDNPTTPSKQEKSSHDTDSNPSFDEVSTQVVDPQTERFLRESGC